MKRLALAGLLALSACQEASDDPAAPANAGIALEQAARARGLVTDPSTIDPVGLYSGDTDRVCIVSADAGYRIGATVDYGEGQTCLARGTATGKGRLEVRLGEACAFTARIEGERIVFPAILPSGCERACRGRASLATLAADRLSASESEARSAPAPDRAPLCG